MKNMKQNCSNKTQRTSFQDVRQRLDLVFLGKFVVFFWGPQEARSAAERLVAQLPERVVRKGQVCRELS